MEIDLLQKTVDTWSETFHGIIPEESLHRACMAAKRNPDRSPQEARFPIKDTEVLQAWYKIKAAQFVARPADHCAMCRLHASEPDRFKPCPFHAGADTKTPVGAENQEDQIHGYKVQ